MPTTSGRRGRLLLLALGIVAVVLAILGGSVWFFGGSARAAGSAAPVSAAAAEGPRRSPRPHAAATVHYDLLAKLLADDRRSQPPDVWLAQLSEQAAQPTIPTQPHPLLDQVAPDFSLPDSEGQIWNISEHTRRGPVIIVFYLGYFCSACVHTLFELNADMDRFHHLGAEVVAISGDSPELTNGRFADYGAFGFPVLCDGDHAVAQAFGAYQPAAGGAAEIVLHATLLVRPDGKIVWASRGEIPFADTRTLLYEVARLQNRLPTALSTKAISAGAISTAESVAP